MRLRISSVIFGLSIGLATIILLYQIFNLPADSHLDTSTNKKQEGLALLESRLKRLEEDIVANHETIKEIKFLIKSLANSESANNLLLQGVPEAKNILPKHFGNKFHRPGSQGDLELDSGKRTSNFLTLNFSKALIQQDDCIFCQTPPSNVDIQMKDVYDILPFDNPDGGAWKQGWNIEYDDSQWSRQNKLKVFVIPHSHNDPGWIKTIDRYFEDQTRHILDNMVVKLSEDHRRKFIWAEISFFSMWWDRQPLEVKDIVKRLVESGQFEIVTGGWVMTDEASAHYGAMLDQLLTGHEWLQLNLGIKPNNGWSIDPFGMSPTMAYILKKSGLQNMLIQRTHYSLKKHFAKEKSLEFRWRQIWDTESETDILCHMMPFYSYDVPHTCGPDPKVCCQFDFRRLSGSGLVCPWKIAPQIINENNVDPRSRLLLDQYRKKAQLYKTNVLLVPLGDDFRYDKASEWDNQFINYQKIFDHMNSKEEFNVQAQFGTLADYFRALRDDLGNFGDVSAGNPEEIFPSLSGDFFTYSDRDQHYWTGYFTSRPFYKRMNRVLQMYLRSAEILFSLMLETETHSGWSRNQQEVIYALMEDLSQARRHHGLFQHHDAITGTSKNHVVLDYAYKMLSGIRLSQHVIQQGVHSLLSQNARTGEEEATSSYFELGEQFAHQNSLPEVVVRRVSTQSPFSVYVFNPDAHKRQHLLTVRIDTPYVQVRDRSGEYVSCQVDPVFNLDGSPVVDEFEVHFLVSVDAISLSAFTIEAVNQYKVDNRLTAYGRVELRHSMKMDLHQVFSASVNEKDEPIHLSCGHLTANFSSEGLLQRVTSNGVTQNMKISFLKYDGGYGGAYLFLPHGSAQELKLKRVPLTIVEGPLMTKVTLKHNIFKHVVILKNSPGVDGLSVQIDNYVDMKNEKNVELAMKVSTNVKNENVFYTDLNGFQLIKRVWYDKLPLQANIYPLASQMFIEDQEHRVSLLTASPVGGASPQAGDMMVFLDRQLMQDDERGLGHGIHDNVLTLHSFVLLIEQKIQTQESTLKQEIPSGFASLTSHASISLLLYPSLVLHSVSKNQEYANHWNIGGELPCDVELVSLRSLVATRQPGAPQPPSSTMALTLHRVGFTCSYPPFGLTCSTNNGKVRLSDLFPATFSEEVKQMSLSQLYEGVDMSKSYTLSMRPMELYSFKLFISSVN